MVKRPENVRGHRHLGNYSQFIKKASLDIGADLCSPFIIGWKEIKVCMSPNAKAEKYPADVHHLSICLYLPYLKGQLSQITVIVDLMSSHVATFGAEVWRYPPLKIVLPPQ